MHPCACGLAGRRREGVVVVIVSKKTCGFFFLVCGSCYFVVSIVVLWVR